jgi:hypothetical protein
MHRESIYECMRYCANECIFNARCEMQIYFDLQIYKCNYKIWKIELIDLADRKWHGMNSEL